MKPSVEPIFSIEGNERLTVNFNRLNSVLPVACIFYQLGDAENTTCTMSIVYEAGDRKAIEKQSGLAV